MKKIIVFQLMTMTICLSSLSAQISQYDHPPFIVGQQPMSTSESQAVAMHPDLLIIGDLDQADYSAYKLFLGNGDNYQIEGSSIIPSEGFNGILYVPCSVSDGLLSSNTFELEVLVYPKINTYPSIAGMQIIANPEEGIKKALEKFRKLKLQKGLPQGGAEILFKKGIYRIDETLILDESLSGEPGKPVILRSYPGEKAIFQGGTALVYENFHPITTPGIKERILDKKAAEKVLEIDLKASGITELGMSSRRGYGFRKEALPEAVFNVNGETQTLARYPNASYSKMIEEVTDSKYSFICRDEHITNWALAKDIWMDGSICKPWEWSMNEVESIDPLTLEIKLKHPEYSAIDSTTPIFHFKNLLEEIDKPGEYYIDAEEAKLYYLPSEDFGPKSSIYLSVLKEDMVEFSENASYIWLEGFLFENGRAGGISVDGSHNRIMDCEIRCFSKTGITVAGKHQQIIDSRIHHTGMEAVILNTRRTNDRLLIPSCNVLVNSEVDHFSLWHRAYKPGLRMQGVGTGVSHCLLHHGPHMGITVSGNNHVFEYTDVHHTPEEFSDMLSMYIITGNSPQHRGTVVRRSYFHDVNTKWKQGAGVYMDNETFGVAVYENFFYNSGGDESGWSVMIHGGGDNIVRSNVFVDCAFPFMVSTRLNTYAKDHFPRYLKRWSRTFSERYPFMDTTACKHLIYYPELVHFFDDDDGSRASTPYTFEPVENDTGEIQNYWTLRTPATNVFENNLVYNSSDHPFKMGEEKEGVREIREFYVVNGFRYKDGKLLDLLIHSNNHLWKNDPGFVDYQGLDFTIKENAPVLEKIPGLETIPFRKIGLKK